MRVRISIMVSGIAFGAAACSAGESSQQQWENLPTRESQERLVEGLTPTQPKRRFLRYLTKTETPQEAGLPIPQEADLSDTAAGSDWATARAEIAKKRADSGWSEDPPEGKTRVMFVDGNELWEEEYDSNALAELAQLAAERGINNASEGGDAGAPREPGLEELRTRRAAPGVLPQGWSNGTDSRVRKPINGTYPINHRELGRIGELNGGGCSGVLVGRRLLLTAAHCVVPANGAQIPHTVRIRRSGGTSPYGAVTTSSYWWGSEWTNNDCHINRVFDPCSQFDWALLRLPDNAWDSSPNGTPGWMGYWKYSKSFIQNNAVSNNDGYPHCAFDGAPSGCSSNPNDIWGQTSSGTAVGFMWEQGPSIPRYYRTSRDISGGHSGSPNWTDYPGSNGPYVIGIAMWEHCFGADCGSQSGDIETHPNGYRGMNAFLADFISDKRAQYP